MKFQMNHDLHIHTQLSVCSGDPEATVANIVHDTHERGFDTICFTDHYWDKKIPGASPFYEVQDFDHVAQSLPLPKVDGMRVLFGCETEYCGNGKLAMPMERFDDFDFVIIPPNHYHMGDLTIGKMQFDNTDEAAKMFADRFLELSLLDLPWRKIGIAHLTCDLVDPAHEYPDVYRKVDLDKMQEAFTNFAKNGAGIELNDECFRKDWDFTDEGLTLYKLARDCGCKFYRGSDSHNRVTLFYCKGVTRAATELLELTEEQKYIVPER